MMMSIKKRTRLTRSLHSITAVFVLAFGIATAVPILSSANVSDSIVYAAPADDPALPEPKPLPKDCPNGQCIIDKYINPAINTLSALIGVAVTASIIYAGIQYGSSADNPQKVSEAKQRIVTSVFVLGGYFVFYAFLNWLIPGGVAPI